MLRGQFNLQKMMEKIRRDGKSKPSCVGKKRVLYKGLPVEEAAL